MITETQKLCSELIAIPSINPQSQREYDQSLFGEQRVAQFLADWFRARGFDPELKEVSPGRSNVLVRIAGKDRSRRYLFCGHLDTVNVEGMDRPFEPLVKDGRIYGRGACDDKGPLAAICVAAVEAAATGQLPCDIDILASCGEEYNMMGALHFAHQDGEGLTGAVFAEPTNFDVIFAHKGVARLDIDVPGVSVHSSMPEKGDNALYTAAETLLAIRQFAIDKKSQAEHQLLGTETVVATIIKGGQQINIVPDLCNIKVDWRTLPGVTAAQCAEQLQAYLRAKVKPGINVSVMESAAAAMESDQNSDMISKLSAAAASIAQGGKTKVAGYATDASAFAQMGIPLAVFGPGLASQAHRVDEYIDIEQLNIGKEILKQFMLSL